MKLEKCLGGIIMNKFMTKSMELFIGYKNKLSNKISGIDNKIKILIKDIKHLQDEINNFVLNDIFNDKNDNDIEKLENQLEEYQTKLKRLQSQKNQLQLLRKNFTKNPTTANLIYDIKKETLNTVNEINKKCNENLEDYLYHTREQIKIKKKIELLRESMADMIHNTNEIIPKENMIYPAKCIPRIIEYPTPENYINELNKIENREKNIEKDKKQAEIRKKFLNEIKIFDLEKQEKRDNKKLGEQKAKEAAKMQIAKNKIEREKAITKKNNNELSTLNEPQKKEN